jgi:rare lipoprotein A
VQAAQTGEVSEAVLVEDTTPRPLLVAGAPDGEAAFLPAVVVPEPAPAPEPEPEPQPEPAPQAASSAWSGVASWYGAELAGRSTASGETFDPGALTAAHRTLPFGTQVRVTLEATGQSVIVRINDRGPYSGGREIDLSRAAADAIGLTSRGTGTVTLEVV